MPYSYSSDFKKYVIQRIEKGESIKTLSQELRVSQSTIYQWRKTSQGIQIGEGAYTVREIEKMIKSLHRLEYEKEILRLSGCLNKIPLDERLTRLEKIHGETDCFTTSELCEALNVARGTFYHRIFRRPDRSKYQEEQMQLMLKVQQLSLC